MVLEAYLSVYPHKMWRQRQRQRQRQQQQQHYLVITFPAQGHINPAHHLTCRLAATTGALVTFSTAVSAHRRMFSSSSSTTTTSPLLSYAPYSDGYDNGFNQKTSSTTLFMSTSKTVGSRSLANLIPSLAAGGRPVTRLIYTLLLPWAADVANSFAVPSTLFWIQPATVFAIYHRYFHGLDAVVEAHKDDPSFPLEISGLPPLHIKDLPGFLTLSTTVTNDFYTKILYAFKDLFQTLASELHKPVVLVNTFDALERGALEAVEEVELVAVGPVMDIGVGTDTSPDIFEQDTRGYMEWLDEKEEGSVVYVAFGSFAELSERQVEEISRGLEESGRPYLWAARGSGGDKVGAAGMMVRWCAQMKVLAHRAVGCFVTHCGWNSVTEGLVCGVPMVMAPQWSDQPTNAWLLEEWGVGVRCGLDGEGVLERRELQRCVNLVMVEEGMEVRRKAVEWRERAAEAMSEGGSSVQNLKAAMEKFGVLIPKEL